MDTISFWAANQSRQTDSKENWRPQQSAGNLVGMTSRIALIFTLVPALALADAYDFKIYQLGNPQAGATGFTPSANANFRAFARQFAAAISSVNLMPPETLGHSAFAMSAEISVVDFGANPTLPTESPFKGPLLIPSLHIRKGLPWSFELGARGAWIEKSRMGVGTVELKWALNEGFTYLPDIAVKGSVTKLINSRDFDLTIGGVDLGIGKQFALAGMMTITPYVGWNLMFVGASTGNVDFNPTRTAMESDAPGNQFKDYFVFNGVQAAANSHNRFYGGLRIIGGVVMIGGEVSYSIIGKFKDGAIDKDVPGVLAFNGTLGLDF
jgi:hypothetical protein